MRSLVSLLVLASSVTAASADPALATSSAADARGIIGGGVVVASDQFVNAGLAIEGAVRIPKTPLYVRGLGSLGGSVDAEGGGSFQRIVGGIEANTCRAHRGFCVFAGLDVGYQHQTWEKEDEMEDHHGLLVGPRLGFDAGSEATRFRMSIDLPSYRHVSSVSDTQWQTSTGVTLSVVRRL